MRWERRLPRFAGTTCIPELRGQSAPLATVDGDKAYPGNNPAGAPLATVQGGNKMDAAVAAVYFLLL